MLAVPIDFFRRIAELNRGQGTHRSCTSDLNAEHALFTTVVAVSSPNDLLFLSTEVIAVCCFSQPVVSVTDTNIFARMSTDGWQYLVYQMKFESMENNAIILPLPVELPATDDDSLEFISLEAYGDFFKDLSKGFPLARSRALPAAGGIDSAAPANRALLKVHDVGEFNASFVPRVADFDRLDEQFRIPPETWSEIPAYADYGFAVFQLKSLKGKPHPMAFRFRSRLSEPNAETVFFPTVHIHDGEVHAREAFDHKLYLQAPEFDEACGAYQQRPRLVTDPTTGYVRSKWEAGEFCDIRKSKGILDENGLVHQLEMRGRFANTDVLAKLDLADNQERAQFFSPRTTAAVACIGGVAGLTWLINRRNTVSGTQLKKDS